MTSLSILAGRTVHGQIKQGRSSDVATCHAFDMIYLAGRNDATIQLSQLCGVTWLCHQYTGCCSC